MLEGRDKISTELQRIIDERTEPWGIHVVSVEVRDVLIPPALEDAMSMQARAERERQARMILGDSERQVAEKFGEAAKTYLHNPVALHLRAMNMLYKGLKQNATIVVVPSTALESMQLGGLAGITALTMGSARMARTVRASLLATRRLRDCGGRRASGRSSHAMRSDASRAAPRGGEEAVMLRNLKDLGRYTVNATDGDIGSVVDFLLDDDRWTIRYLIVKAGGFFDGRHVLISPASFREADGSTQRFHLALTRDKVKNSPNVDVDRPVSRQFEHEYYQYYNYTYYWASSGFGGLGAYPPSAVAYPPSTERGTWEKTPDGPDEETRNSHLRSAKEVTGYHIRGSDGTIGHVADFIVDDGTWEVRYLVVDTSHWWAPDKKVLVAPAWASSVDWPKREVHIALTRQAIKASPPWDAATEISREYEGRLYDHFGRPVYWGHEGLPDKARSLATQTVAGRAYELYEQHGRLKDHAEQDWLQAERELRTPGANAPRT
jgi:hypothetical protein